jgi:hypothetical protein
LKKSLKERSKEKSENLEDYRTELPLLLVQSTFIGNQSCCCQEVKDFRLLSVFQFQSKKIFSQGWEKPQVEISRKAIKTSSRPHQSTLERIPRRVRALL